MIFLFPFKTMKDSFPFLFVSLAFLSLAVPLSSSRVSQRSLTVPIESLLQNTPWNTEGPAFDFPSTADDDYFSLTPSEGAGGVAAADRKDAAYASPLSKDRKGKTKKINKGKLTIRIVGVAALLLAAFVFKLAYEEFKRPPLKDLLRRPPFPPGLEATSLQLATARAKLETRNIDDSLFAGFRRGYGVQDVHIELYLKSLQDRIDAQPSLLSSTFIFHNWLAVDGDKTEPQLPRLHEKDLEKCAAANFILFPLKLPLGAEREDENTHYILGVIDRSKGLVRIVDGVQQQQQQYAAAAAHLLQLAAQLETQLAGIGRARKPPYEVARDVPELGFATATVSAFQHWPQMRTAASGLLLLNNAASIVEGRKPQEIIRTRQQLAELLYVELGFGDSRMSFLS